MTNASMQTRPTVAAVSMVCAMAVIGFIDIFVTVIAETISVWQFLVMRMVLSSPLIVLLSFLGFGTLRPVNVPGVVVRSTLIAVAMFLYFGALGFMPIAMALAGLFTSPIFVLLITAYVLRQPIGPWRIAAVFIGFAGILVVLGPSGHALGWALLMPVLGGLLYACGVVATRSLCADESTLTLLFGIFVMQALIGSVVMVALSFFDTTALTGGMAFLTREWVWALEPVLPYMVLQVFGSILGVGLLNRAYQLGEASRLSVFEYTIMIFGPFFGWLFLGQMIFPMQIAGIVLIAAAGVIIALRTREA